MDHNTEARNMLVTIGDRLAGRAVQEGEKREYGTKVADNIAILLGIHVSTVKRYMNGDLMIPPGRILIISLLHELSPLELKTRLEQAVVKTNLGSK